MSLSRQLWLAVTLVTLINFIGSFGVSMFSIRSYIEQQLHQKNIDSATSLALAISQLSKDPITVGLQISALFDTGQYEAISITAPDGSIIDERIQAPVAAGVPDWFMDLLPIDVEAGRAQATDNGMHFGVIKVASQSRLGYSTLWDQAGTLMIWYLVAGALAGLIGVLIVHSIKKPLVTMADQAEAITNRHFLTISEPRIPELRSIARATNDLIRQLHNRKLEESSRLADLNERMNLDPVTGLANREYFMVRLREMIENHAHARDGAQAGVLFLIRLEKLEQINQKLGRIETDKLLGNVGSLLSHIGETSDGESSGLLAARMNGSDFMLMVPGSDDTKAIADRIVSKLTALLSPIGAVGNEIANICHIGAVRYRRGDELRKLLASADAALAAAEGTGRTPVQAPAVQGSPAAANIGDWRHIFNDAFSEDRFKLALYPVVGRTGGLLHQEVAVRMQAQHNGGWLDAADFIAIAVRLNLTGMLDLTVIRHALDHLHSSPGDLAINLSIETVADWGFRNKLGELLRRHPDLCPRIWLEVTEYDAFRKFEAFQGFCDTFKEIGCHIGVDHVCHSAGELEKLAALGLDYFKVDASLVHRINQNRENQRRLKELCGMAQRTGIILIACGVQTEAEQKALVKLGFDGLTGAGIEARLKR
jgi:diguanylate cyclase (GGDEF)-like protein